MHLGWSIIDQDNKDNRDHDKSKAFIPILTHFYKNTKRLWKDKVKHMKMACMKT